MREIRADLSFPNSSMTVHCPVKAAVAQAGQPYGPVYQRGLLSLGTRDGKSFFLVALDGLELSFPWYFLKPGGPAAPDDIP